MSGLVYALAAPLVAIFGWFFLLPVFVLASLARAIWRSDAFARVRHRLLFFLGGGCSVGAVVMGIIAACGIARGPEPAWAWAFPCTGATSGFIACYLVTLLNARSPNKALQPTAFGGG